MASWLQSPTPDGQKHPDAPHPARPGLCARAGAGVGHSGATPRSQQDRLTHRAGKCAHVYPPTVISDFRGKSARTVTRSSTERSFKGTVTRGPQTSVLSISCRHPQFPSAARQPGERRCRRWGHGTAELRRALPLGAPRPPGGPPRPAPPRPSRRPDAPLRAPPVAAPSSAVLAGAALWRPRGCADLRLSADRRRRFC